MQPKQKNSMGTTQNHLLVMLLALLVVDMSAAFEQADLDEQQVGAASTVRGKLVAVPNSLTRFLFYNARPTERQPREIGGTGMSLGGYKRSSSALDALTGVTLGKRSAPPIEVVNWEPMLTRQYTLRAQPAAYEMRLTPLDSLDGLHYYRNN